MTEVAVEAVKKRWPGARRACLGWEIDTRDADVFDAVHAALDAEGLRPARGGDRYLFRVIEGVAVRVQDRPIAQATSATIPRIAP